MNKVNYILHLIVITINFLNCACYDKDVGYNKKNY